MRETGFDRFISAAGIVCRLLVCVVIIVLFAILINEEVIL